MSKTELTLDEQIDELCQTTEAVDAWKQHYRQKAKTLINQEKERLLLRLSKHIGDLNMERVGIPDIDSGTPFRELERKHFLSVIEEELSKVKKG